MTHAIRQFASKIPALNTLSTTTEGSGEFSRASAARDAALAHHESILRSAVLERDSVTEQALASPAEQDVSALASQTETAMRGDIACQTRGCAHNTSVESVSMRGSAALLAEFAQGQANDAFELCAVPKKKTSVHKRKLRHEGQWRAGLKRLYKPYRICLSCGQPVQLHFMCKCSTKSLTFPRN